MKNVIIVLVCLGLAVGLYFVFKSNPTDDSIKKDEAGEVLENKDLSNNNPAEGTSKKMSFDSFIKNSGGSYVCDVSQSVSGTESKGTVYVKGGNSMQDRKISGEFKTSTQGINITSNFIMKEGYSYSWTSMMPTGYKVKVNDVEGDTETNTSGNINFDSKQIGEYDCKDWVLDESKFTLPSNIKFTEIKQ